MVKDSNVIFAGANNATDKPAVKDKSKDVTLGTSKCGTPWKKGTTRSNLHVTPFNKKSYDTKVKERKEHKAIALRSKERVHK